MLKQETRKRKLKPKKLNRKLALTILLYSNLEEGVRRSTTDMMIKFKTNQADFYDAIKVLSALGVAKAHSGSVRGGVERTKIITLKELCDLLRIEYETDDKVISKCKNKLKENAHLYKCDVCESKVEFVDRDCICLDCAKLTPELPPLRKAKCGHMSRYRYYKCEKCLETLPHDDDSEDITYTVHI